MPTSSFIFLLSTRSRRWLFFANIAVSIGLACFIFVLGNFLSFRHFTRLNWRRHSVARLSDSSLRQLEAMVQDIQIVVLLRPAHEAFRSVELLLQEVQAKAPNCKVEFVDPDRDRARTEQLATQMDWSGREGIAISMGGRTQLIPATALLEEAPTGALQADSMRRFYGEILLGRAVHALTQATRPVICFLQGHGERSPNDFDRHVGFSRVATHLRDANMDVELLDLGATKTVPNRCSVLVVAGPTKEFSPFEIALLRDYLNRKGRLFLLLDAHVRTGLEPLLQEWGVLLGDDVIVDDARTFSGRELHVSSYPAHPITESLAGIASVFFLPRSVRARTGELSADKPIVLPLALCTATGWAELNPDDTTAHFDPQVDLPGPLPVAVAVERGIVPGVHVQIRPTRLVVFGDSDFATNGGLMGANADFFLNSVRWLVECESRFEASATPFEELGLVLDSHQLRHLFWIAGIGLPGCFALVGLCRIWRRRG